MPCARKRNEGRARLLNVKDFAPQYPDISRFKHQIFVCKLGGKASLRVRRGPNMSLTFTKTLVPVLSLCIASCSGGSSGSIAPPAVDPSQTSAATVRHDNVALTEAGSIAAMIKGGFTLWNSSCGYVHVFVTSSTKMSGPKPAVHSNASVSG